VNVLDRAFPPEQSDPDIRLHGLAWLPSSGPHHHYHQVAPPTPLGVEQAGEVDHPPVTSPAKPFAALKRIALRRAWKTVKK
jgi:hypothetical protein